MGLTIHNLIFRILISFAVFIAVIVIVVPHVMDVHPPLVVKILLTPSELMAAAVSPFLPLHNIGTPEKPFYEATPIHLLVGIALVLLNVHLYPVLTYIGMSLLSVILQRRANR